MTNDLGLHKITLKGGFHSSDTQLFLDDKPLMDVEKFEYSIESGSLATCVVTMRAEVEIESEMLPEAIKVRYAATREQVKDFVPGGKFTLRSEVPATRWQKIISRLERKITHGAKS